MTESPLHDDHRDEEQRQIKELAVNSIERHDGEAVASVPAASGHRPPGKRAEVVDSVANDPRVKGADSVSIAVPRGDTEALDKAREHLLDSQTHVAGASVIVEGRPRPSDSTEPNADAEHA